MIVSTLSEQFYNLDPSQRQYFYNLASGSDSSVMDYFEKVPPELRSNPELVEKYLNGDPQLGIGDRDWSHIEPSSIGGSDEASNGFFEDASINRARGAETVTPDELFEASVESEADTQTLIESVEGVADATVWAETAELAGAAFDFTFDCLAPVVGGGMAAKVVADQFARPRDKWGFGSIAGGLTVAALASPVGQIGIGCYLGYRVFKRGQQFYQRRLAN